MRRGWTLLEMLVAVALSTIVLASAWLLFSLGNRGRGVTATARALQTAMLIQEHLQNDLARMIAPGLPFRFDGENGRKLGFYVIDPRHTPDTEIGVRAVVYRLAEPGQLLRREVGTEVQSIGASPLTSVSFRPFRSTTGPMLRVVLEVGRSKDEPDGRSYVHTFLVRAAPHGGTEGLTIKPLVKFAKADEPKKNEEQLPVPPGLFKR